ncbi:MAG: EamA family transporter [Candidatus Promineifilaceae bacterium]|nr:EamA family transporter [Candidatus Promineifilaceae bacterium]
MSIESRGLILLALLSLIWGAYFLLIEIADDSVPPLAIATVRLGIGALVLYPVLKWQGGRLPPLGREWAPFVIIGLFEALLTTILVSFGETHISSALAAVLFSTMPVFTVLLGHLWLREPFTLNKTLGVAIGFIGTLIVLLPTLSQGAGAGAVLLGALAVLLASLSKAFAALYSHNVLKAREPLETAVTMMICAAAIGLPLTLILENPAQINPTLESLVALIALGVFTAGIGFLLFFWLVKHRGPTFASIVRFNEPPIAIFLAAIFAGTAIHWTTLLGTAVILLCIAIMNGYLDPLLQRNNIVNRG